MIEYEDWGSARIAQLEQQDMERYQRDISRNSSYSYDDQTPNYNDEFQSKLSELLDMVHQLSSDLKRTTSSIENRSALPTMDLHPLSFVDDDASCIYSKLESETTDEQLSDEEMVVNELPDSTEMDFDGIQGNDSSNSEIVTDLEEFKVSESAINSHFLVDRSNQKQLTSMNSGFMVLSIYCAHMASKWNDILEMRPEQSHGMSVEVYYNLFFNWKKKLEEVNYIGGEESHIDDFLYGLKRELAVGVWENEWKSYTLYGAFRRAEIVENMMKNDADKVLEEMPQLNSSDIQGAENVSDVYGNIALDTSLGSKFTIKETFIEVDSEPSQFWLQKHVEHDEGKVVGDSMVPFWFNLQVSLGPLGDITVEGSNNNSTKSWHDEATLAIKNMHRKYVIDDDAYKVFGEITQAIRAALLDEEVMNHSAKYDDFNKLILFDSGGSKKCAMSFSREATRLLFGKAQGMVVWGFEGVTSTHSHANSFLYTSHRNSLQTLFHDMDKYTDAMMILGALKCLQGEMVHLFVFIHPEDVVPAGLSIQGVHFKLAGRALLALAYIEHMAYTLLDNNLSYQKAVVRRITHKDFHLLEQLHVGLMNKFRVPIVIEVAHLGDMYGFHVNLQCIGAVFVMILIHPVRCRPFDPGGNLLLQMEVNILKVDALSLVLVIIQRVAFFIFVWDKGHGALIDYILVDKDFFKRVGNRILVMVMIRSIRDCRHLWDLEMYMSLFIAAIHLAIGEATYTYMLCLEVT